jgi:chromosome segregation ATPase
VDLKKELEDSITASSATASSLLEHQDRLEKEKDQLNSELVDMRKTMSSMKNGYDELQIKFRSLSTSVDTLTSEKQEYESRQEQLNKQLTKLTMAESELTIVRDELNRWKLEHAKTSGMLNRLQTEKDASERKHGQSTALVGMLESQLAETSEKLSLSQARLEETLYIVGQKDDEIRSLRVNLEKLEENLSQLQSSRQAASDTANQTFDRELTKKSKLIEVLQKEVQSLQQQMTKRSSAAQKFIQEREAECQELKKRNKALQDEIDNGSLSDRRIFELAAQQSTRDIRATNEIEVREKMLQKITDQLADRDTELANAELSIRQRQVEMETLCRKQRRDDVNTDYLKSVFVQYLSKPPGSSERSSILPILATLLQFDDNDYKIIEEGKNKISWLGQVMPTFITSEIPPTK